MLIVTVLFETRPGAEAEFAPLMRAQASNSLEREPGCEQFDVCRDPGEPSHFFLYEVYRDRTAFDEHLASAHYQAFDEAVSDLVARKTVRLFEREE